MSVIGIDPSLNGTGIATADGQTTIRCLKTDGDKRLALIHDALTLTIRRHQPKLAVLEDMLVKTPNAGIGGMVQGVIRLTLIAAHVPYALVPPATLKKYACGRGNADKADLRIELFKRAGLDIRSDDEVDAYWLRQIGLYHLGLPCLQLPKAHTDALDKVDWPAGNPW